MRSTVAVGPVDPVRNGMTLVVVGLAELRWQALLHRSMGEVLRGPG
ncbi:hypothetical protein ACFVDQ_04405 [Streptomyces sp. NPDC057684]